MKVGSSYNSLQPLSSMKRSKTNDRVEGDGQSREYDKQSSSFDMSLKEFAPAPSLPSSPPRTSESAVDALIRLGASSRANHVDLTGEWRSVVYQLSDMDQDGSVTQAELLQSVVVGGGIEADANALYAFFKQFASTDSEEGSLTVDDFKHGLATSSQNGGFKTILNDFLDSNGDGEISSDELDALFNELRKAGTDFSEK